jgi:hypothetical protein
LLHLVRVEKGRRDQTRSSSHQKRPVFLLTAPFFRHISPPAQSTPACVLHTVGKLRRRATTFALESLIFVACRRLDLRLNICPESVFSFAVSRTRHGTDFSDVSPANQVVSVRYTCSSRCTSTPFLFWSSNQPKRCSNDFPIVDRSLDQITVSVSVTPRHGLTFRGSPTLLQCSVFNQISPIRIRVQPSFSTSLDPRRSTSSSLAIFLQSCSQQVSSFSLQLSKIQLTRCYRLPCMILV